VKAKRSTQAINTSDQHSTQAINTSDQHKPGGTLAPCQVDMLIAGPVAKGPHLGLLARSEVLHWPLCRPTWHDKGHLACSIFIGEVVSNP